MGRDSTVLQFVSIYLLILAFFILLVTISIVDKEKVDAVAESVNPNEINRPESGPVLAGQVFQDKSIKNT